MCVCVKYVCVLDTLSSTFLYGVRVMRVALFVIAKFVMFTVQRVAERCSAVQSGVVRCSVLRWIFKIRLQVCT